MTERYKEFRMLNFDSIRENYQGSQNVDDFLMESEQIFRWVMDLRLEKEAD